MAKRKKAARKIGVIDDDEQVDEGRDLVFEVQRRLEGMEHEEIQEIEELAIKLEAADAQIKHWRGVKEEAAASLIRELGLRGISQYKGGDRVVTIVAKSDAISIKKVNKLRIGES